MRNDTDSEKLEDEKKELEALKKQKRDLELAAAAPDYSGGEGPATNAAAQAKLDRLSELEKKYSNPTSIEPASPPASAPNAKPTATPPATDASRARDYAFKLMTGQTSEAPPAEIKDAVASMQNDPDLKKAVADYKSDIAKKDQEEKTRREKAAADEKAAKEKPSAPESAPLPTSAVPKAQNAPVDAATALNTQIAQLVQHSRETAEATRRTASLIQSRGNLLNS
jgi:hypothetical protein